MQKKSAPQTKKTPLVGKVLNAADIVSYGVGAVSSRTVIDRKTGTVTFFAFDKGEGLSEHVAPFDAMVMILDGAALITIEGKPFTVKKGEFIIMPAGKVHALRAVKKFKMALVMVRG